MTVLAVAAKTIIAPTPAKNAVRTTMEMAQPLLKSSDDFFVRLGSDRTYTNSYTLNFSPSSTLDGHRLTYQVGEKYIFVFPLVFNFTLYLDS